MFVIEVIPLKRGAIPESLTYYSATAYEIGVLIQIPVRSQELLGLVVGTQPVSLAKTALKTAVFSLRKLPLNTQTSHIPQGMVRTVEKLTTWYPSKVGTILYNLLPPQVRDGQYHYPRTKSYQGVQGVPPELITDTTENRFIAYKTLIRETFAHRGSVLFVVPTAAEVSQARTLLEKGIEHRVVTFCSTHTKKELERAYHAFEDLSAAKVCIVTPAYAFLDRQDMTTIIVEASGSPYYVQKNRPYIDIREALTMFAQTTKRALIFGDTLPRTEDEQRRRMEMFGTHNEHSARLDFTSTLVVAEQPKKESGEAFSLLTNSVSDTLARTLTGLGPGHVFLYGARKGLATLVTCFDCGHIFRCPDSGAPYSLLRTHRGEVEERWFISSTSGKKIRADDTCPGCGGWRLSPRGIGVQQIYDYAREHYPKVDTILFDHTTATTHKKALALMKQFYDAKRAILIGTHMALPYLTKPVEVSCVVSYEAMRATPTWRIDEHTLRTLFLLREKTTRDVVVQVRTGPDDVLSFAERGLIEQFYDSEIATRKALLYPPFATFILLSWVGSKEQIKTVEEVIISAVGKDVQVQFYNAPQGEEGQILRYGLIRLEAGGAEKNTLIQSLTHLPPYIKIEINPERIV